MSRSRLFAPALLAILALTVPACDDDGLQEGPSARLSAECRGGNIAPGGGRIDDTIGADYDFPIGLDASIAPSNDAAPVGGGGDSGACAEGQCCPCVWYRAERVLRLAFRRAGDTQAWLQVEVPDFDREVGFYRVRDLVAAGVVTLSDAGTSGQRAAFSTPPATCDLSADEIQPAITRTPPDAGDHCPRQGTYFGIRGRVRCTGLADAGESCFATGADFTAQCLER